MLQERAAYAPQTRMWLSANIIIKEMMVYRRVKVNTFLELILANDVISLGCSVVLVFIDDLKNKYW